jgi:predicted CXXCH cytochrome family protein
MRYTLVGLILLALAGVFLVSCDEHARHEALTFFFDGVPPMRVVQPAEGVADADVQKTTQTNQTPTWYVHEPRKDCTLCHGKRERTWWPAPKAHLIELPPKLCYGCHDNYAASAPFVHGPVAVGQCLLCHEHHKSRFEHLLKEPPPTLCYQCHDAETVQSIPEHITKQQYACTDCHYAHASSTRPLLKPSYQKFVELERTMAVGAALQDYLRNAPEQGINGAPDQIHTTTPQETNLFRAFRQASQLVEQGKLQEAREYLEVIKNSQIFTEDERERIARVLRLLSTDSIATQQYIKEIRQQPLTDTRKEGEPTAIEKKNYQTHEQRQEIAELYYRSLAFYRAGRFEEAREGFSMVLRSEAIPEPMAKTIRDYISNINNILAGRSQPRN